MEETYWLFLNLASMFYLIYLFFCGCEMIYQFSLKYKIKSIMFYQNLNFGTSCFGEKR